MKKMELPKKSRKQLEKEIRRNRLQKRDNHKDMKRLQHKYITYFFQQRTKKFVPIFEEEIEGMVNIKGEAIRGVLS